MSTEEIEDDGPLAGAGNYRLLAPQSQKLVRQPTS